MAAAGGGKLQKQHLAIDDFVRLVVHKQLVLSWVCLYEPRANLWAVSMASDSYICSSQHVRRASTQ